ncbi:glycosyltransferase family 2 protein [Bacillus sp. T3]|uniref:glycosyltransferase family 2 protein n=1 Tax=Bacillus sp. T3 TaxID=467262 RepID=UPI0029818F37|nr:glycosyltransferase family 2 protein [Bacillus sp. T3]
MGVPKKTSKVSVIIQAQNEQETIGGLINEIKRLNPHETIVVVNGSTDDTEKIAKNLDCNVIIFSEALGINVGKSIGALKAEGDILLFLDGDMVIKAEKLKPFITAIENGNDVALNDLNILIRKKRIFTTSLCKVALNTLLKRRDLLVNSFVAIPNAISKAALRKIGWWNLTDPPTTQAMAVLHNLKITIPTKINVVGLNPIRKETHKTRERNSPYMKSTSRIVGDHISALNLLINERGKRGGFTGERDFTVLKKVNSYPFQFEKHSKVKRSAVISVDSKKKNLESNIRQLLHANVEDIVLLIEKNNLDSINKYTEMEQVTLVELPETYQPFMSRVLGANNATGENILFIESDKPITSWEVLNFYTEAEKGVGIVLNKDSHFLESMYPICQQTIIKCFLNTIIKKPSFLNNSLYSTPHVLNRKVLEQIGTESLMIPALAYTKAITAGYTISAPYAIGEEGIQLDDDLVLGDHLEAIKYYLSKAGIRGGFNDGGKNRKLLEQLKIEEGDLDVE